MRINYVTPVGEEFASYRYRISLPSCQAMWSASICNKVDNADINVFSKHWDGDIERIKNCETRTVYDICDDHFDREKGGHYREMIEHADVITCNSFAMRKRIKLATGRESVVIGDPFESKLKDPKFEPYGVTRLCWFGSPTNLHTLKGLAIPGALEVVSAFKKPGIDFGAILTPWSMAAQLRAIERCDIVIIPGTKECGSANRLIEAFMNGRFVVASSSPAYDEFKDFAYIGDIVFGVKLARDNPKEIVSRIARAQSHIMEKYSPRSIAKLWKNLFESILDVDAES